MKREVRRFPVRTNEDTARTIVVYAALDVRDRGGDLPPEEVEGARGLWTVEGQPVQQRGPGHYEIVETGEFLAADSPDAR